MFIAALFIIAKECEHYQNVPQLIVDKQMYPILPPGMSASLRVAKTRVKGSPGALLLHFLKVSVAMLS